MLDFSIDVSQSITIRKGKKNVGAFLCLVSKHRSKKCIATLSLNISIFISCKRRMMNEVVGTKKKCMWCG